MCCVSDSVYVAIFLGVLVVLLFNVMEVLSRLGEVLCWIDHVWSSKGICVVRVIPMCI